MTQCKVCGKRLSLWFLLAYRDDGLCSKECKATFSLRQADPATARTHLIQLLDQIRSGQSWRAVGLCTWTSGGHKLGQTAGLWAGRALLGVAGDILHAETVLLGVVGISSEECFALGKIGEIIEAQRVEPQRVNGAALDKEATMAARLSELQVAQRNGSLLVDDGYIGGAFALRFPPSFLPGNEDFAANHILGRPQAGAGAA